MNKTEFENAWQSIEQYGKMNIEIDTDRYGCFRCTEYNINGDVITFYNRLNGNITRVELASVKTVIPVIQRTNELAKRLLKGKYKWIYEFMDIFDTLQTDTDQPIRLLINDKEIIANHYKYDSLVLHVNNSTYHELHINPFYKKSIKDYDFDNRIYLYLIDKEHSNSDPVSVITDTDRVYFIGVDKQ